MKSGNSFCYLSYVSYVQHASSVLGLEYSGGEGTNYPPKFDSAPGKPICSFLFLCIPILFEAVCPQCDSIELFLIDSQVPGGLLKKSGVLRTGMRM